jgi:beta-N-acetylhexosaminidase
MMLLAACHGPTSVPLAASPSTTFPISPSTAVATTSPPTTYPPTAFPPTAHPSTTFPPMVGPTTSCSNRTVLAGWSTARLAEQTVVIPVDEDDVASITAQVQAGAGGVILFGSQAPADLGGSLAQLVGAAPDGIAPFIMTDEEGGAVERMANLVGSMPSARTMAATMTAAQIQQLGLTVGRKMRAAGVTMDLAPVLDLDDGPGPSDTDPDGTRSFSAQESIAQSDGLAFASGLRAAGVIPVVKHFPGLGGATGNTDAMAAATLPWSDLQTDGLLPFAAAVRSGVPAVMVANATVPGLTDIPASLSPTVITGVLRGQLGFSGLVITDSLSANAVQAAGYSVPGAGAQALQAGADLVLFNATPTTVATLTQQVVAAIVTGVNAGSLTRSRLENAVGHILSAKHVNLCQP